MLLSCCTQDFSRRDSFSAVQPGNLSFQQSADKFSDHHVSAQAHFSSPPPPPSEFSSPQSQFSPPPPSSYSSPPYQGTDYPPPSDVHTQHNNYSSASYPTTDDYPTNEVHKPPTNYSPPPYRRTDHPSDDGYNNPQSNDTPDVSAAYPHNTYQQQPPYTIDPQHTSQNYYATETPPAPYNYPNFQSYPSFHDSTLPSVTTHQPPFHPASDGVMTAPSYSPSSASNHPPTQYHPGADATHYQATPAAATAAPPASQYMYDSNYQPAVEKIAEAHKAARFAVGALAFDDVSIAVEHLKRALDLLTNPSAETH
jgi:vacuolar protein sorting-associated protein VTA1